MLSTALIIVLVVVALVVIAAIALVAWVVRGQNNLVKADELCGNSLSQIGVQQASRWDALTSLADLAKQYSDQEYKTIMDTIKARQGIDPKSSAEAVDKQEAELNRGLAQINALAEAYPDLKSNTVYVKTMDGVNRYEDNVRMSRMVYNDSVTKYNRLVRSLPGAWVAGNLGFGPREYLQDDDTKADMPDLGSKQ